MARLDDALSEARSQAHELIDRSIEKLRSQLHNAPQSRGGPTAPYASDPVTFLELVRRCRERRGDCLPQRLFADPAWDILLELTHARLEHREVTVKVVQSAAMVPASTSIRWLHTLEEEGLITRRVDPLDHRRTLVALTETGWEAMAKWLDSVLS